MATPDTRHSIVILKSFDYRGVGRTFSNRYHFEGALPADDAHWSTLAGHITDAEQLIYDTTVEIIQATGYDSGSATSTNPHGDAVFSETFTKAGSTNFSASGIWTPGDAAGFIRYSTPARSTKNHPVYLSNYYHGCWGSPGNTDQLLALQKTHYEDYADSWLAGFTDGAIVHERCGPRGAVATSRNVSLYVHHRDFPA